MKTKLTIAILLGVITFAFIYKNTIVEKRENVSEPVSNVETPLWTGTSQNHFLLGVMSDGINQNFQYIDDSLGLNTWHLYLGSTTINNKKYPEGWIDTGYGCPNDHLFEPGGNYTGQVNTELANIYNHHNMQALMQRPKIEYLCYGQRSDYRCVDTTHVNTDLWFYSFQSNQPGHTHTGGDWEDNSRWGENQWVKRCLTMPTSPDLPGYVVDRLRANNEQTHRSIGYGDDYRWDSQSDWLIKPRVRIDSTFAANPQNYNTPVCRVDVYNSAGNLFKSVLLNVRHFLVDNNGNSYNGEYIEEFKYQINDSVLFYHGDWATDANQFYWAVRGNQLSGETNKTDIQVYWYGNCDMWIDYVRVDNDIADGLFKGLYDDPIHHPESDWLHWEAGDIAGAGGDVTAAAYRFYIELFEFNQIPCMSYVSHKLDSICNVRSGKHISVMADPLPFYGFVVPWANYLATLDPVRVGRKYIEKAGATEIFTGHYPFAASYDNNNGQHSEIPSTLNTSNTHILAIPQAPSVYDYWLQEQLDAIPSDYGDPGHPPVDKHSTPYIFPPNKGYYRFAMEHGNAISRNENIPFIAWAQAHQWVIRDGEVEREPTNEELDLLANLPVAYGAKGIIWFEYHSWGSDSDLNYSYGLVNMNGGSYDGQPRHQNVYGQDKWAKFVEIIKRLKKWEPYVMSFDNRYSKSYIYRYESYRNDLLNNSYFADVVTYKQGATQPNCNYYDGPGVTSPSGLIYDCPDDRYLQIATFQKSQSDGSQYFMIVNKRCSPYKDEANEDNRGGRRDVRIRFDANAGVFAHYNNWNILDVANDRFSRPFDKTQSTLLDLGWFLPGEGRLYKIVPVPLNGGTLVCDEVITDQSFTCEDTVWNNGYNIYFKGNGNTISFSDSATIIMSGGTFQTDSATHGMQTTKNIFQPAVSGHKWAGLKFDNCDVKIYNSSFSGVSSPAGGNYAINSVNSSLNDIRYNTFSSSSDTSGGVSVSYTTSLDAAPNTYILYNTFTMNSSFSRAVQVQGFAGQTVGVYIESNTMTANGNATGVMLSTVTGGVMKNNTITGFSTGINTIFAGCELYGNTISNTSSASTGILGTGKSSLQMVPSGSVWLAGLNYITNTSGDSKNIEVNNSVFNLDGGKNTFDVTSTGSPYHLYGSFWNGSYLTRGRQNCFKLSGTQTSTPLCSVTDSAGSSNVTITFSPLCGGTPPTGASIVDIGNGLYDTIPAPDGYGGGESSVGQRHAFDSPVNLSPGEIYDSIRVQLRHRNFNIVKNLCYELIENYPDSAETVASLQTLYIASTITDTTTTGRNTLKTYYENLILYHAGNEALVEISNYLLQKCKVLLGQYSSALAGFQLIINNNQYVFEGLLARWDYMATSLLMNGGSGGVTSELRSDIDNELDDDAIASDGVGNGDPDGDKSPFSREQRITIKKAINNSLGITKYKQEEKIKTITKQAESGDEGAKRELQQKMALKNIIKTERPKNLAEHLRIVNNDIQTVFGSKINNSRSSGNNNIPTVFKLYQNYPNPFNPTATIKFDIPQNAKVNIKVYDLLGRQVKQLVDEFKQAGSYTVNFDGTNLASGVYFYRIEAGDFVDAKKMVLVK